MTTVASDTGIGQKSLHLLERGAELELMRESLRALAAGEHGICIFLEAPAGMGKTSLIQACAEMAQNVGVSVLIARASALESQFAFGVARQLLEPALWRLDPRERFEVLSGPAANAAPVFSGPVTDDAEREDDDRTDAVAPADGSMQLALHALITKLARRHPLLVLVDDIQSCDEPSLRFLAFLARRVAPIQVMLVLASRMPGLWVAPSLRAAFLRDPSVLRLRPRPLSSGAVEALLTDATAQKAEPLFASACRQITGGNPFFLTELVWTMLDEGIAPIEASIERARRLGSEAIELSVRERLERLPPLAGETARAVAVLGDGCSPEWVARLTGSTTEAVVTIADQLRGVGLLSPERELTFLHSILRSAVYDAIPVGERDILHGRAAALAQERHADPEVVAAHLALTSVPADARAGDTFRAAADAALARGAPGTAATYLSRALEMEHDPVERCSLLLRLGGAEARARLPSAAAHLTEVLATTRDPDERVSAALALWSTDSFDGRVAQGLDMLRSARAGADGATDDLLVRLDLELARAARSSRSTAAEGRDRVARLADCTPVISDGLDRVRAGLVAYDAMLANEHRDTVVAMIEQALPISDADFERSESQLLHIPLYTLIFCDEIERARDAIAAVAASAGQRGATVGAVVPVLWGGFASLRAGQLDDAERLATIALAQSTEHSWYFGQAASQLWLGEIALERNEINVAGRIFGAITSALASRPDLDNKGWADQMLHGRALWKLAAGNADGALADLLYIGARHDEFLTPCPAELAWRSNAARCAAALGDGGTALRLASEELDLAQMFAAPRALGIALRVHGEVTGSRASLSDAVSVLERSPALLELARARTALGSHLRRAGRDDEARDLLRAGLEDATRLTATGVARRARDELLAAGGRPPPRPATDDGTLSSSELRVVRFAAQGLSNPDIARALYLSRRTVETHLYHAYRKLGIRSRAELAAAFEG